MKGIAECKFNHPVLIKNNNLFVSTTGPQGSGILRSMSKANCLIILPSHIIQVNKGEKVQIQLIEHDEIL